ncbi:hypothetical protein M1615_02560 [Patescibacteria group bacterium]|nr:hypothetical protein [Patescibacteria group bacterium]
MLSPENNKNFFVRTVEDYNTLKYGGTITAGVAFLKLMIDSGNNDFGALGLASFGLIVAGFGRALKDAEKSKQS